MVWYSGFLLSLFLARSVCHPLAVRPPAARRTRLKHVGTHLLLHGVTGHGPRVTGPQANGPMRQGRSHAHEGRKDFLPTCRAAGRTKSRGTTHPFTRSETRGPRGDGLTGHGIPRAPARCPQAPKTPREPTGARGRSRAHGIAHGPQLMSSRYAGLRACKQMGTWTTVPRNDGAAGHGPRATGHGPSAAGARRTSP